MPAPSAPDAYLLALGGSALVTAGLGVVAWYNRPDPGTRPLAGNLAASTVWLVTTLAAWTSPDLATSMLWRRLSYVGITLNILFLFLFVLEYVGREDLVTRRTVAALAVQPVVANALVWTNDLHGLVWAVETTPGTPATLSYGPAFAGIVGYSYLVVFASLGLLVRAWRSSQAFYRRQMLPVFVAILAPFAGNVVFLATGTPYDLAPIAFAVTGTVFSWAILRHEFLDLAPVARNELVGDLDSPVVVFDEEGRLVDVNDAGAAFLDDPDLGARMKTVLSEHPTLRECCARGEGVEGLVTERDGEKRYYDVRVRPVSRGGGARGGTILALTDVTGLQRRTEQLEQQNERLELLASSIAHDLRNPLNVAKLNVDLVHDEARREEAAERIEATLDRMEAIIEDMLTLARQDDHADTAPVDLADAARTAWDHVDTADATLVTDPAEGAVLADEGQLLTLLENLFRNAVEHGSTDPDSQARQDAVEHGFTSSRPEADDAVTVTVGTTEAGFYVADDGPGIPADERHEVFEHGYTTNEDGTGFGLAIVEQVVEAHDWTVSVTEGTDGGARFDLAGVATPEAVRSD